MPRCTVIPELAYEDVGEAIDWLCEAFGFTLRVRIGNHRAQLNVGDGAVVLTELRRREMEPATGDVDLAHAVMVRVSDAKGHYEHARERGARVLGPPVDYPYGERQYTARERPGTTCQAWLTYRVELMESLGGTRRWPAGHARSGPDTRAR
jgi:uncharacterized glyoxalase superfamily protein PhnB